VNQNLSSVYTVQKDSIGSRPNILWIFPGIVQGEWGKIGIIFYAGITRVKDEHVSYRYMCTYRIGGSSKTFSARRKILSLNMDIEDLENLSVR